MLEEVNDYSLMDLWSDEDNNESSEADQLKYVKKKFGSKIFRGLISISVKLIKGDEEVNKSNQDRFYEEITRQKTNIFLKRIHNMISHEILEFPRIQSDIKISLKDDLKRIRFSYHFHEEHILSTQPSSSLNTLAYQLSKKQTKFVLKNFHKEIFEKIKRDPKLLFQQSVRTQSAELFTDFLLSEQTIFFILKFM
jgi:23S rRNA U2552 (ribose-2'-O)-methylase RlmE/FtsJ